MVVNEKPTPKIELVSVRLPSELLRCLDELKKRGKKQDICYRSSCYILGSHLGKYHN